MKRYNIALLPTDQTLQANICALSQKYFGALHDDYILGPQGWAHVTLCQFHASGDDEARAAFDGLTLPTPFSLKIVKFHVRPGTLVNAGKFIAEYKIQPQPDLMAAQRQTADHLARNGLKPLTSVETYSPHITLARLNEIPAMLPALDELPLLSGIAMRPSLGLSTESGVFIRSL